MKKTFFTLIFAALFGTSAPLAQASEADKIPVGNLEIWSIVDAEGQQNRDLIPELGKYPELEPLFANGPLPGVTKTYFFKNGNRNILVDAGWGKDGGNNGQTVETLKDNGIKPEDVTDILLTHMDIDHISGLLAEDKAMFPNAALWISRPEFEAWTQGKINKRSESAVKTALKAASAYKDRIRLFDYGEEILPGVTSVDASGHTPGHTAYDIKSGDEKMTIAGDIMHLAPVQLLHPELSSVYDMDADKAAQSRERLLNRAAQEKSQFGGMHFQMVSPVMQRSDTGFAMREPRRM